MTLRADRKTLERGSLLLHSLASSVRLHILVALLRSRGGLVASDIGSRVGLAPAALSHQLRLLEQGRVIEGIREGQHIRYRLARTAQARLARRIVQLLCETRSRC